MNLIKNKILYFITFFSIFLSFLGFLDATYLTIIHYKHIIPPCSFARTCETVLTSQYATIGAIPIALLGSVFYILLLVLLVLVLDKNKKTLLLLLEILTSSGLIVSILLVYIQGGILHAFCQYCLGSEAINSILFITITYLYSYRKRIDK